MTKFRAGDQVRSDTNLGGGVGRVLAWDDPRCPFAPEDWSNHTVVEWEDESVTILADGSLSSATAVAWDQEAEGPEE